MRDTLKTFLISLVVSTTVLFGLGPAMLQLQNSAPATWGLVSTVPTSMQRVSSKQNGIEATEITAPNIVGMKISEAQERWRGHGITVIEDGQRIDATVRPGVILERNPSGGALLKQKEIRVIVATTPVTTPVPNVVTMKLDAARELLVKADFQVPPAISEASELPSGNVIRQDPNPGTQATAGTPIKLVVSQQTLEIPKLIGKRKKAAQEALEKLGFKVGTVTRREHDEWSSGRVMGQDPKPGENHPVGTAINLVLVAPDY